MGDNPSFYFQYLCFYLSQEVCLLLQQLLCIFIFLAMLCQVRSLVESFCQIWISAQETDLCLSPLNSPFIPEATKCFEIFCAESSYMYATFYSSVIFDLSNYSASKKFVFTECSDFDRFCLFIVHCFFCDVYVDLFDYLSISGCR